MPTFTIATPEGKKLRIEAPDQAAALRGAQEWSAQNAPKAKALADARGQFAKNAKGPFAGWNEAMTARARGAMFGVMDEAQGGVAALATGARNSLARMTGGKGAGYGMRDAYEATAQASREQERDYAARHPVVNFANQTAGGAWLPVGRAMTGGSLASTTVRSAAIGAGVGGFYGAASADGDASARLSGARQGAMTGAAIGAAAPVVARGLQMTGRVASDAVAKPVARTVARAANRAVGAATGGRVTVLPPEAEAVKRITEEMARDRLSPAQMEEALAAWSETGASSPQFLNLVGENTRALFRAAAGKPGPARDMAVKHAERVAADLQDNVIGRTAKLTPDARPARVIEGEARLARAEAARSEMDRIGDQLVTLTPDSVQGLRSDLANAAIKEAAQNALASSDPSVRNIGARLNRLAADVVDKPSAVTLDLRSAQDISKSLLDAADSAFKGGNGARGKALADLGRSIRNNAGSPEQGGFSEYGDWLKKYADDSAALDALDVGRGGMNASPDDFALDLAAVNTTPQAQTLAQTGYRQAITDAVGNPTAGATGVLNRLSTSTNQTRNLATAFGADEAARYQGAVSNEVKKVGDARFISPNTNSQTASRQSDALELLGALPSKVSQGVAFVIDKLLRGATLTDAEREALIRIGIDPAEVSMTKVRQMPPPPTRGKSYGTRAVAPAVRMVTDQERQ